MNVLRHATRSLKREFLAGDLLTVFAALVLGVAAMTAVGTLVDRVTLALTSSAAEVVGGDLGLRGREEPPAEFADQGAAAARVAQRAHGRLPQRAVPRRGQPDGHGQGCRRRLSAARAVAGRPRSFGPAGRAGRHAGTGHGLCRSAPARRTRRRRRRRHRIRQRTTAHRRRAAGRTGRVGRAAADGAATAGQSRRYRQRRPARSRQPCLVPADVRRRGGRHRRPAPMAAAAPGRTRAPW